MPDLQHETQPQAREPKKQLDGKGAWAMRLGWLFLTFMAIYFVFRKRLMRFSKKLMSN